VKQKKLNASLVANGKIYLPGSKSITNRVLLMSALSNGETLIQNYLDSDDTQQMLNALKILKVEFNIVEKKDILVKGCNHNFPNKNAKLFLGNAGTAFRPLTAVLAIMGGEYILKGINRMHERPIKDLVDSLIKIGAEIDYIENPGYPPLKISPGNIICDKNIKIKGNVSSQYLTSLLIAAPLSNQDLKIQIIGNLISKPYIDITLKLLAQFGIKYKKNNEWTNFALSSSSRFKSPKTIKVEGDASSASYFFAAGAIGGSVEVANINKSSIQGDLEFLKIIKKMGANVEYLSNSIKVSKNKQLVGMVVDCRNIPDAAMTLAILALFAKGPTTLKSIGSWRVKETDRISAMETELKKLGATVSTTKSSITIKPPKILNNNTIIDTYDDHRMAMCFSLVCLANKNIVINDPECTNKTYPNFFKDFGGIID
jgi:3-phosphoshikimate 1-carboxyvinyltransferase